MKAVKLIRDGVCPREHPDVDVFHTGSKELLALVLTAKLHEEAAELAANMQDPVEYGDVLETLMTLARLNGVGWDEVVAAQHSKYQQKGGFTIGRILVVRR